MVFILLLGPIFLGFDASAHEQKEYTIILGGTDVSPENASALLVGDGAFFRMEDSSNNSSQTVIIDTDGNGQYNSTDWTSGVLTYSCETDENGTKMDDSCNKTALLLFNSSSDIGTFSFRVELEDGSFRFGNITISADEHLDDGGPPADYCIGTDCPADGLSEDVDGASDDGGMNSRQILLAIAVLMGGTGVFLLLSGDHNSTKKEEE
jgi:hypothetical protein